MDTHTYTEEAIGKVWNTERKSQTDRWTEKQSQGERDKV